MAFADGNAQRISSIIRPRVCARINYAIGVI